MKIEMKNWNMFQKCFSDLFVAQCNTFGDSIYSSLLLYMYNTTLIKNIFVEVITL